MSNGLPTKGTGRREVSSGIKLRLKIKVFKKALKKRQMRVRTMAKSDS